MPWRQTRTGVNLRIAGPSLTALAPYLALLGSIACATDEPVAPAPRNEGVVAALGAGIVSPDQTQLWCEQHPEECGGGSSEDPDPNAPGIWFGSTVTPTMCFSQPGFGINDVDHDGLADHCEEAIAEQFRPELVYSQWDCDMGMEPYWAAKYFPANSPGPPFEIVRVAYLLGYYRDCGAPPANGSLCSWGQLIGTVATLNGLLPSWSIGALPVTNEDLCAGHEGDSEFVIVDIRFDAASQHWVTESAYFSAHWRTDGDHSRRASGDDLIFSGPAGTFLSVWVARGKHANYPSVQACEEDGGIADTCAANYRRLRIRAGPAFNVGSAQANAFNPGTCVAGGSLAQYYPQNYGIECFWSASPLFAGWDLYGVGVTPYRSPLVVQFECYSYRYRFLGDQGCSSWGVNTLDL